MHRAHGVPRPVQLDRAQARLLAGATVGSLATVIARPHYDTAGRAVETADIIVPADRFDLAYSVPVAPEPTTADAARQGLFPVEARTQA